MYQVPGVNIADLRYQNLCFPRECNSSINILSYLFILVVLRLNRGVSRNFSSGADSIFKEGAEKFSSFIRGKNRFCPPKNSLPLSNNRQEAGHNIFIVLASNPPHYVSFSSGAYAPYTPWLCTPLRLNMIYCHRME